MNRFLGIGLTAAAALAAGANVEAGPEVSHVERVAVSEPQDDCNFNAMLVGWIVREYASGEVEFIQPEAPIEDPVVCD